MCLSPASSSERKRSTSGLRDKVTGNSPKALLKHNSIVVMMSPCSGVSYTIICCSVGWPHGNPPGSTLPLFSRGDYILSAHNEFSKTEYEEVKGTEELVSLLSQSNAYSIHLKT